MAGNNQLLRPGDLAPVSGVYLVTHAGNHREPHEALVIRGEELPACRVCKADVRFTVADNISHITHDWDFTGPLRLTIHKPKLPRAFPRAKLRMPVSIEAAGRDPTSQVHGELRDLSLGGMAATLEASLPATHSPVIVVIDTGQLPLRIPARVRYCDGYRHGFEFATLSEEMRAWVDSQLPKTTAAENGA